jgi:hypothetical protein
MDYVLETVGLPEFVNAAIEERLRERGMDMTFDTARCGVVGGVTLSNPRLLDPGYGGHVVFSADEVSFSLVFLLPFTKELASSNGFHVKNGRISVPLFPETGEEGLNDTFEVTDFNASGEITDSGLEIRHLSGNLGPFSFTMAGDLENVLRPRKGKRDEDYRFSLAPLVDNVPFHIRAKIYRRYLQWTAPGFFEEAPSCDAVFHVDAAHLGDTMLMSCVELPGFEDSGVKVKSATARVTFENSELTLDELNVDLVNDSEFSMTGRYSVSTDQLSVVLKGKLHRDDAMGLLANVAPDAVESVALGSGPVEFSARLRDFSFSTLKINGTAKLEVPELEVKGLAMRSLSMDVEVAEEMVEIRHFSFDTAINHVEGKGEFYPWSQSVDGVAWCYGPPLFVLPFLEGISKKNAAEFFGRFTFPRDKTKTRLDTFVHFSWYDKTRYFLSGTVSIDAPFKYNAAGFDSGKARVVFDENNVFIVPSMSLRQSDGSARLSIVYEENDGSGYAVASPFFSSSKGPCQRALIELRSDIPGKDVLGCVLPEVDPPALDLSYKANLAAAGSIDLLHDENTNFSIDVIDSKIEWNKIPLESLNCDLRFEGVKMIVEGAKAKVRGGDLNMDLTCDFENGSGSFKLDLKDAEFAALVRRLEWKMNSDKGKISVKAEADYGTGGKGLTMNGTGTVAIRGANLWEVPFVSNMGRLVKPMVGGHLGVISDLDADCEFKGDHLRTENARTDGDVVSLTAEGSYYWESKDFDFLIRARILKRFLPFDWASKIFSPFAGLFQTTVTRKNGRVQWKKLTLIDKFLDGAGRLSDPNL